MTPDDAHRAPAPRSGTDHDDGLGTRLRTGLDALTRQAGPPPAFDDLAASIPPAAAGRWGGGRTLAAAAAIVAVLALAAGVVALTRDDGDGQISAGGPTTTAATGTTATTDSGGDRSLMDTNWWLVAATDDGDPVEVAGRGTQFLGIQFYEVTCPRAPEPEREGGSGGPYVPPCEPGPVVVGSDACNGVARRITVEGDEIRLGDRFGASTDMACASPLAALAQEMWGSDRLTYRIEGDELQISGGAGAVLTYRAIDGPFGPTESDIVDEGEREGVPYRLIWMEDGGLELQQAETGGDGDRFGQPGVTGVGADPGRVNAMFGGSYGTPYLFGIVPGNSARVVFTPAGGDPMELTVHDVDDPDFKVVGQFVDGDQARQWTMTAFDAAGNEIHTLRWG